MAALPGWYEQGDSMRYWDGATWTDRYAPIPSGPSALVILGYIFALLMPFVGIIFGVIVGTRKDRARYRHGIPIILVSIVGAGLYIAVVLGSR